jgi:DNA (cytosine-5)-methyltransferase 1
MAGYDELLAIDIDDNSVRTFSANFPEIPVWKRDIRKITGEEIMEACKIGKGELDLLDGSPPCQGFSMSGKRRISDPRNDMYREFIRMVDELRPKVFVMENVPGMVYGKMRGMFVEIIRSMKSRDYSVRCKMLNAENYGVPQSRKRLFFIGIRSDIFASLTLSDMFPTPERRKLKADDYLEDAPPDVNTKLMRSHHRLWIEIGVNGGDINNIYPNSKGFSFKRIRPDAPSFTITKSEKTISHPTIPRYLTVIELKRLSSFPDDFIFIGNYNQTWNRIGNAVMPRQMYAIAMTIKKGVFDLSKSDKIRQKQGILCDRKS